MTLQERLAKSAFPRASKYDPQWLMNTAMGPHVLWLAEWVSQALDLQPGMRVLDLGCGRAASSIFLAREFGLNVCAADLWIKPTENWERIKHAGVADRVMPLHVEAHTMPFAEEYFDAIVSFDAYHYFGTDDLYLSHATRVLRPGGTLGTAVPCILHELDDVPQHLRPFWVWDFCSFHSPAWWRNHWEKTGLVKVEVADAMQNGWKLWLEWNELRAEFGDESQRKGLLEEARMLREDAGRTLGFARVVARRS